MKKEKLIKPNLSKPAFKIFPKMADRIKKSKCTTCNDRILKFRDELSRKEYSISGMCQECQDKVFN